MYVRAFMVLVMAFVGFGGLAEADNSSMLECIINDNQLVIDGPKKVVTLTVSPSISTTTGISIIGYAINWGDDATSAKGSDTHHYAPTVLEPVITASYMVKFANGSVKTVSGPGCIRHIDFAASHIPVQSPPPSNQNDLPNLILPNTGGGNVVMLFITGSCLMSGLYYWYLRHRLNQD